jgi:hypothetical protein
LIESWTHHKICMYILNLICSFLLQIGHLGDLPNQPIANYETCEEFLKKAHHVLLEVGRLSSLPLLSPTLWTDPFTSL